MFKGSIVALVTPMQPDGVIDKKSLHDLIEWHISTKTDGIVVAGTTGEASTLSKEEHIDLIATVVNQVAKRIPVIAGTGTNSTLSTIELTQHAQNVGADAALIVTPYYNKPTQHGLFEHYKKITENVSLPLLLYNVPGRTACDLLPETIERLAQLPTIVGIKEATSQIDRGIEIRKRCGKGFVILSGDDITALDLMLECQAEGIISVTANIIPAKMHELCTTALNEHKTQAKEIQQFLMPLHTSLFLEANPIPTKWVLHQMGRIPSGIRLPLLPLDPKFHTNLKEAMKKTGIV